MATQKSAALTKWHPKIAKFRTAVEGRSQIRDVFVDPSFEIECINSGSSILNLLIGGSRNNNGKFVCPGYPKGMIVEIYGRESSGKSTLALTAMAQAIAQSGGQGCGLYVDLECAVKDHYAMKLGVDFRPPELGGSGHAIRAQPHTFEETESLVMSAALSGIDLIVIDSVAGLVSRRDIKRDTSDEKQKQGVAEVPRLMSAWMPKLQGVIARTKTCVIFLNQTRDKIGAKGFSEEALKSTTGGNALKFWANLRIMLKPKMSTKASIFNPVTKSFEDVQISTDIEVKMIKNKIDAKQGHSGLITIRYGVGIDEMRSMLNVAEAYNIVTKSKNNRKQDVYKFKSPSTGKVVEAVGIEKFRLALGSGDGALAIEMSSICAERVMQGFQTLDEQALADLMDGAVSKKTDTDDDYEDSDEPETTFGSDSESDESGESDEESESSSSVEINADDL